MLADRWLLSSRVEQSDWTWKEDRYIYTSESAGVTKERQS